MRRTVCALALSALLLAGCTADPVSEAHPYPEVPEGFGPVDEAGITPLVNTLTSATRIAAGEDRTIEEIQTLDPGTDDPEEIIEAYAEQLEGWEEGRILNGHIGRSWERDDQRFVLAILAVEGDLVVVTFASTRNPET